MRKRRKKRFLDHLEGVATKVSIISFQLTSSYTQKKMFFSHMAQKVWAKEICDL